jgi:predicted NAD/FAD-dependent oxidoreductase
MIFPFPLIRAAQGRVVSGATDRAAVREWTERCGPTRPAGDGPQGVSQPYPLILFNKCIADYLTNQLYIYLNLRADTRRHRRGWWLGYEFCGWLWFVFSFHPAFQVGNFRF